MWLMVLLLGVFFITLAMMVANGLWTNALIFFNTLLAGLLAMSFFEPLANVLKGLESSYDYLWDFISWWFLFFVFISILRVATDMLSKVQVRFKKPVDIAGGIFFALWTGWLMVCLAAMTLHLAPLAANPFKGAFFPNAGGGDPFAAADSSPDQTLAALKGRFFGLDPDLKWLAFAHSVTRNDPEGTGPLCRGEGYTFDPRADFITRYYFSRLAAEKEPELRVKEGRK